MFQAFVYLFCVARVGTWGLLHAGLAFEYRAIVPEPMPLFIADVVEAVEV